jgi:hypothetical protein
VQYVKLDGAKGGIDHSAVPEIRLVSGMPELSIDGQAPASALRKVSYNDAVEISVTHNSTEIVHLAVDDAEIELSYR